MAGVREALTQRRLRFLRDFPWSPPERGGRTTIRYLAGKTYLCRRECAIAAVAAKAAVAVEKDEATE